MHLVSTIAPPIRGCTYCVACNECHAATRNGTPYSRLCWPCHREAEAFAAEDARSYDLDTDHDPWARSDAAW